MHATASVSFRLDHESKLTDRVNIVKEMSYVPRQVRTFLGKRVSLFMDVLSRDFPFNLRGEIKYCLNIRRFKIYHDLATVP